MFGINEKKEITSNQDNRGRFLPGNCANPKGRPKNAEPDLLREALKREGEKRGEDFWRKVAEYAFRDKQVMIAVMKKFVPDISQVENTGVAQQIINVIRAGEKIENKTDKNGDK